MEPDPTATNSCFQRPLRRCRHIPQHETVFSKSIAYSIKLTGASMPSQITLYCGLLRVSNKSPLDLAGCGTLHGFTAHNPTERWAILRQRDAGLVCLTAKEGGDVEQIFFLAQARSVVRLERGEPRLGNLLCRLGRRTRCQFRRRGACATHSGHSFNKTGHSPLRLRRGFLD